MEGRRPVGRPKKTWSKVVEEDVRKLNITEDMAEDRKQRRRFISRPTPKSGQLGTFLWTLNWVLDLQWADRFVEFSKKRRQFVYLPLLRRRSNVRNVSKYSLLFTV